MKIYVVVVHLIGIVYSSSLWDCRNPQLSCKSSYQCSNTGECLHCTGRGHDCGFDLGHKDGFNCTADLCKNDAMCSDTEANGADPICYCTPEYTGPTCNTKRFTVECTKTGMSVTLKPEFTPHGGIYVLGQSNCSATEWSSGTFTKMLKYNGEPGSCSPIPKTTQGTVRTWKSMFLVQEDLNVVTISDFVVIFECMFDSETLLSYDVTSVHVDSNTIGITSDTDHFGGVTLTADPDDRDQIVGQEIEFTLTGDSSEIKKIRITKIDVKAPDQTTITIVENGCVKPNKKAFISVAPATTSSKLHEATVTLLVVKFKDFADLEWVFTVVKCLSIDTNCINAPQCITVRRKREAEQVNDNSTDVVTYKINVVESIQNTPRLLKKDRPSECVNTDKMTAALVAMAVACFVLLVICLVFIVRTLSSRRNVNGSKLNLIEEARYNVPRMVVPK